MPIWFYQAIGAMLFWTVGYTILKRGFAHVTPLWNNIIANAFTLIFWFLPAYYLSGYQFPVPSLQELLTVCIIVVCYMTFPYVISKGQLALTNALFSLYPLFTILFAVPILKETLNGMQVLGVLFALIGTVFVAWPAEKVEVTHTSWVKWGLFGAIVAGFGDFLNKVSSIAITAYGNIMLMSLLFNIFSLVNYAVDAKGRKPPEFTLKALGPTLLAWCFILTGGLLFLLAFDTGSASLVSTVSATHPGMVAILSVLFLKERLTFMHTVGIGSIVLAIIFIGLGTS